jgi:hypothetical protein
VTSLRDDIEREAKNYVKLVQRAVTHLELDDGFDLVLAGNVKNASDRLAERHPHMDRFVLGFVLASVISAILHGASGGSSPR